MAPGAPPGYRFAGRLVEGWVMNHELSLRLELLEESAEGLRYRLALQNKSGVKLLLPYPEIHGLRFSNELTKQESEWYTRSLVSSSWSGLTLPRSTEKAVEFHVRPCSVEGPATDDFSDYYRWCVDLPAGEYLVWFRYGVNEDYFCPDSHYVYTNLLAEAKAQRAVVWNGQVLSNRLHLSRG